MIVNFKEKDKYNFLNDLILAEVKGHRYDAIDQFAAEYYIRGTRYCFSIHIMGATIFNSKKSSLRINWFLKTKSGPLSISFDQVLESKYISNKAKQFLIFNLDIFRHSTK